MSLSTEGRVVFVATRIVCIGYARRLAAIGFGVRLGAVTVPTNWLPRATSLRRVIVYLRRSYSVWLTGEVTLPSRQAARRGNITRHGVCQFINIRRRHYEHWHRRYCANEYHAGYTSEHCWKYHCSGAWLRDGQRRHTLSRYASRQQVRHCRYTMPTRQRCCLSYTTRRWR